MARRMKHVRGLTPSFKQALYALDMVYVAAGQSYFLARLITFRRSHMVSVSNGAGQGLPCQMSRRMTRTSAVSMFSSVRVDWIRPRRLAELQHFAEDSAKRTHSVGHQVIGRVSLHQTHLPASR
jgi:hypothetical protein